MLLDDHDARAGALTESAPSGPRDGTPRAPLVVLVVGGLLIVAAAAFVVQLQERGRGGFDHRYEIPAGTTARIDAGEAVAIVPSEIHLAAGDTLTIENHDDRRHEIGVFNVGSGETRSYTFPNKGTFVGACTLHSGGGVTIYVA